MQFPFQAILWDIDGTLADSEPVHERSFVLACATLDLELPPDFHAALLGKSDSDTHAWLASHCGLRLPLSAWMERRFEAYFSNISDVQPHGEALALWRLAEEARLPQATVSNSDRLIVNANLRQLGIDRPGLISVSRNDVRNGKPHPEPYLRAAELLRVDPHQVAVVEDSATGLQAAVSAGMTGYLVPWGTEAHECSIPHRLSDLTKLLADGSSPLPR